MKDGATTELLLAGSGREVVSLDRRCHRVLRSPGGFF